MQGYNITRELVSDIHQARREIRDNEATTRLEAGRKLNVASWVRIM